MLDTAAPPEDPIVVLICEKCKDLNLTVFQAREIRDLISALLDSNNNYCPNMRKHREKMHNSTLEQTQIFESCKKFNFLSTSTPELKI